MALRSSRNPRTIFVTGASSGIGLATARYFHERGWNVAATLRRPTQAPIWMRGPRIEAFALDVSDQASVDAAVAAATERFGRIDVAYCNAGYGLNGPLEGATEEQMLRQFDVNVFGVIRTIKGVLPQMRARSEGVILTTSSIGGLIGMPISPLYIASKHAVEGLIESARFELQSFGVRVKLIEPGGIKTEFSERSADWTDHPAYRDSIEAGKKMSVALLDRAPPPEDVAKVVYRAARDRSGRLRYAARPGPYLMLYDVLPDVLWRGMIQSALRRAAA